MDITEPSKSYGTNHLQRLFPMQPSPYGRSDEQQIKVILDDEDRTGVTAAAGSGKTSTVETAIEATHARLFEHNE